MQHDTFLHSNSVRPPHKTWQPLLEEPLRRRALETALCVMENLREPEKVLAVAEVAATQSTLAVPKDPSGMVFGFNGIALPASYFAQCFPEQDWDKIAYRYLDLQRHPDVLTDLSLFGKSSGLAMLLSLLNENGKRYRKTLVDLHEQISEQIMHLAWPLPGKEGIAEGTYDLVSGATGVLAYLLTLEAPTTSVQEAIEKLLRHLINLASTDREMERTRWYTSAQFMPLEQTRQQYPAGYYNCGLAHGIPGPLAVLSLAWLAGYRTSGLREALLFLRDWIMQHAVMDRWGINWPSLVPLPQSYSPTDWQTLPGARAGWCYGAPGISRALWFAGLALEDTSLCQIAVEALEVVLRRPVAERHIDSPTLCHGIAGLLAICLRFAHDTESAIIREHIPLLVTQIVAQYNPAFPLGFRDLEQAHSAIDQTGWLTGAPGTALVLLAASLPVEPTWDRVLLLS